MMRELLRTRLEVRVESNTQGVVASGLKHGCPRDPGLASSRASTKPSSRLDILIIEILRNCMRRILQVYSYNIDGLRGLFKN